MVFADIWTTCLFSDGNICIENMILEKVTLTTFFVVVDKIVYNS